MKRCLWLRWWCSTWAAAGTTGGCAACVDPAHNSKRKKKRTRGEREKPLLLRPSLSLSLLLLFLPKMIEDATLEPLRARGYELGGFLGSGAFSEVRGVFSVKKSKSKLFPFSFCSRAYSPFLSFSSFQQCPGHRGDSDVDGGSGGDQEGHGRRGRRRGVRCIKTAIGATAER